MLLPDSHKHSLENEHTSQGAFGVSTGLNQPFLHHVQILYTDR